MTEQDSGNRFDESRQDGNLDPGSPPPAPRNSQTSFGSEWSSPSPPRWTPPDTGYREGDPGAGQSGFDGPGVPPASLEADGQEQKKVRSRWYSPKRIFRDLIIPLAFAALLAVIAQATLFKPYQIPSGSMEPTIMVSDRILADRIIYRFRDISRGDVIVFDPPTVVNPDTPYVKRVVGLPGDTVEIHGGRVLVNGEQFEVPEASKPLYPMVQEVVPDGMLFVLGDNRNESSDSHIWGYVPESNVIGRADLIYWPFDHARFGL